MLPITDFIKLTLDLQNWTLTLDLLKKLKSDLDVYSDDYELLDSLITEIQNNL